jgi:hypothetical protein
MRAVIRFTNCNGFHPGRIVNFAQGIGIQGVARNQDVDAKIGDAFEFALEVNGGFPIMNGGGGSSPMPRTRRSSPAVAVRILGASPKCSNSERARTGPTPSIRFKATSASQVSI